MANINKEALAEVLAERLAFVNTFVLEKYLFKEQLDFVKDPERFATAVCSVRAGKSIACAADLIDTAIKFPGTTGLYITLARSSAKRIIWPVLRNINNEYKLKAEPNESDLSLKFPNGSIIYCFGAGDANEIEKIRGLSDVALVYLDESQAFRSHIKELVEDIITKRLYDTNGRCRMIGTPGPVPAGYFYECSQSPMWAHHAWTLHKNIWITKKSGKTVEELIAADCKRKGVTQFDPSIQRECFGKWVLDSDSLVFKYSKEKNHYETLPKLTDYVIGVDLGSNSKGNDKDAIAILGWHKNQAECYLVEEFIGQEEGLTPLQNKLEQLINKYKPLKVVIDTGGLGKKLGDELRKRSGLPVVAAEKARKNEFIAITNDGLRTSRLKAKSNSMFAQDALIVEWDSTKSTSDRLVMKSEPHSDICDAVLYAYREALHWLSKPEEPKVNIKTKSAWLLHTEKLMEESLERQIQHQKTQESEADMIALMDMDPFNDNNPLQHYLNKRRNK